MSLPTSRDLTLVAGSAPPVPASLLNSLQDASVDIFRAQGYRNDSWRTVDFRWPWWVPISESASGTVAQPGTPWTIRTTANALALSTTQPTSDIPVVGLGLTPGTANTNAAVARSSVPLVAPASGGWGIFVLEFSFKPQTSLANITWDLGWCSTDSYPDDTACDSLRVRSIAGAAWHLVTNSGGTAVATSLTDVPATGTRQRFRLEYHGAATAVGVADYAGAGANVAKVIAWVDGVRRAVVVGASVPTGYMGLLFRGHCTGAATGDGQLGPLLANIETQSNPGGPLDGISGL